MGWGGFGCKGLHHSSYSELITTKVKTVEPEKKEILTGAIVIFKNQNSYIYKVLAQYNVQNMKFSIRTAPKSYVIIFAFLR